MTHSLIRPGSIVALKMVLRAKDHPHTIETQQQTYTHGNEEILPGLEAALEGRSTGDQLRVLLPASEAFGERSDRPHVNLPLAQIPEANRAAALPMTPLETRAPDGTAETWWIHERTADQLVIAQDHPLAGVDLAVDIDVLSVA